jgi:hypothetical protein
VNPPTRIDCKPDRRAKGNCGLQRHSNSPAGRSGWMRSRCDELMQGVRPNHHEHSDEHTVPGEIALCHDVPCLSVALLRAASTQVVVALDHAPVRLVYSFMQQRLASAYQLRRQYASPTSADRE